MLAGLTSLLNRILARAPKGLSPPMPTSKFEPKKARNEGLPTVAMPEGLCPRCGKQSSFEVGPQQPLTHSGYFIERTGERVPAAYSTVFVLYCRHCTDGTIVVEQPVFDEESQSTSRQAVFWYPTAGAVVDQHVPEPIKGALQESMTAFAAGCLRASTIMSRHALEALLDAHQVKGGNLRDRIEKFAASGGLPPVVCWRCSHA